MKYTLNELLADKDLRKELIEGAFIFNDAEGEFFAVDFQNESMRQNHITVFEVLYSLGGDTLFEALLAGGNTCLTKDPQAAKVGVQPIAGAEGWYLKTNASAAAAFNSILNGLAGLYDESRFSFSVSEESTTTHIVSDSENAYETSLMIDAPELRFVEENDQISILNIDENAPMSFVIQEKGETIEFDKFYRVEGILRDKADEDPEEEQTPSSYKYQLEKGGKVGFFNADFSQVIPPVFEDVILTNGGLLIAWKDCGIGLETADEKKYELCFGKPSWGLNQHTLDLSVSYKTEKGYRGCPSPTAYIETVRLEDEKEFLCYVPQHNIAEAFVFFEENNQVGWGVFDLTQNVRRGRFVTAENGVLSGEGSKRKLFVKTTEEKRDGEIHAADCKKLYFGEAPAYKAVGKLFGGKGYVVERDGYYAVAKFNTPEGIALRSYELDLEEMLTPYAFTEITSATEKYLIVDRFGKKGIFDIVNKTYAIPCDYETIRFREKDTFYVTKGGFGGTVKLDDGKLQWVEHLHRGE